MAGRDDERITAGFFILRKKARFISMILLNYVSHPQFHRPKLRCLMLSCKAVKVFAHLTAFFIFTSVHLHTLF